ncbi:hypothetical protein [Streptomyces sp. NPDC050504]|uniref:hypothetical protein n=1 Tax=Streptomyces sp. NPDC050504 TaxID=3365618 RepID=UPI0037B850A6
MSAQTRNRTGADIRLPWWAVALPVIAFTVLFALVASPAEAQASGEDAGLSRLLHLVQWIFTR